MVKSFYFRLDWRGLFLNLQWDPEQGWYADKFWGKGPKWKNSPRKIRLIFEKDRTHIEFYHRVK